MLTKRTRPDGSEVLERQPFRPEDYQVPKDFLQVFELLHGYSIHELLEMHDQPLGSGLWVERVERDGTSWLRLCSKEDEWCLLVEDSREPVGWGKIVPLPPEEARDVSRSYDARRPLPVVDAAP